MIRRISLTLAAGLALAACAPFAAAPVTPPAAYATQAALVGDKAAYAALAGYRGAIGAVQAGVDTGTIRGPLATRIDGFIAQAEPVRKRLQAAVKVGDQAAETTNAFALLALVGQVQALAAPLKP